MAMKNAIRESVKIVTLVAARNWVSLLLNHGDCPEIHLRNIGFKQLWFYIRLTGVQI